MVVCVTLAAGYCWDVDDDFASCRTHGFRWSNCLGWVTQPLAKTIRMVMGSLCWSGTSSAFVSTRLQSDAQRKEPFRVHSSPKRLWSRKKR